MSNKIKQIENVEEIETAGAADAVFANLSEEQKAKLAEMVTEDPIVEIEEGKGKKALTWFKKNKWKIGGAVLAAAAIGFLGKKAYQAGMPAEFDVSEDVIDADFESYTEVPEVVEEAEEIVE